MRSRMLRAAQFLILIFGICCASGAAADPIPEAKFVETKKDVLIGDTITFCVTFENKGDVEGYAPYIDLVLPSRGHDGPAGGPCDGISYVKAEMIDVNPSPVPLTPAVTTPNAPCGTANPFPHPFTANGANGVVLPNAEDQLITIPLPFGSFEPSQPLVKVRITANVHPFADHGQPLNAYVRGGFRFGKTPINDPPNDGNLLNPSSAVAATWPLPMTITPRVVVLAQRFKGPENEIVPGPSFADAFEVTADVAPGQIINGLGLVDCATAGTVFTAITATTPVGTTSIAPPNCFSVTYGSITGAGPPSGGPDVIIDAKFYVGPGFTMTSCTRPLSNTVKIQKGTWTPQDPRDQGSPNPAIPVSGGISTSIDVKLIAIHKSVTPLSPLGPIPGTTLQYQLVFQVSDYHRFGNLVIEDTYSDGQIYLPATTTLSVRDKYGSITVNAPAYTGTKNVQGTYRCPPHAGECEPAGQAVSSTLPFGTRLRFDVSAAMLGQGTQSFAQGVLTGARVLPVSTIPASGSITFRMSIPQTFTYNHPLAIDDHFVDKDDPLYNAARISAQRYNHSPIVPPQTTGQKCADDTYTCLSVPGDLIEKRVIARNGIPITAAPLSSPPFQHGETITFRLKKIIPSGDAQSVQITDWFPSPAIAVPAAVTLLGPPCSSTPPQLKNQVCYSFAPSPTWTMGSSPSVSTNQTVNSIVFNLGSIQGTAPVTVTVEVTLEISNDPMADELLLTNEAQECEKNSYNTTICRKAIAQFQVTEPALRIYKGILCPIGTCPRTIVDPDVSDPNPDPARQLSPWQPGLPVPPVAVCTSPAPCPRFTGTVNSNTVAGFIGSNTALADAGDRVTFIVAVENRGHSPDGAHDITLQDILPAGMSFVAGSLCVTRGDGVPITTGGATAFPLTLDDPSSGSVGALTPYSATSGRNIAVFTFDVDIGTPSQIAIGSCLTNRAEVTWYSNMEKGLNFVTAGFTPPFFADASVCVKSKSVNKTIIGTSEPHTPVTPLPVKLTIGEIVRYRLMVHVPEGTGTNFHVLDGLPSDLQFLPTQAPTISTSGVHNSLTWSQFTWPLTWTSNVDFNLGTVTNNDNDPGCEYLIIEFNALVMNTALNNDGETKPNSFVVMAAGQAIATSPTVTAQIVEPKLTITKSVKMDVNIAMYTVTVSNPSATTAFDVEISDVVGTCLQNLTVINATSSGGATPPTGTSPVKVQRIPPNGSVVVTYRATATCRECQQLKNTATVTWTSLPGTGTPASGAGNSTPGASGAVDGERDGTGGVNDYITSATASVCGKVCGVKFEDKNGNHVRDANEPLLSGWTITAADTAGTIVATTATAADGSYCLEVPPGTHRICETPQPKWQQTFPTPTCHTVGVAPGATLTPFNFGNRQCWARVCGIKTMQLPGTSAEVPLAGWTFYASPFNGGPPIVSQPTGADGKFCLDLPGPGPYTLTEVQQTGWSITGVPQSGWNTTVPATSYMILIECIPSPKTGAPGTAFVQGGMDDALNIPFRNVNLCSGNQCPAGQQCEVHNGRAVCVTPPSISPCSTVRCGFGLHCAVINGAAECVP